MASWGDVFQDLCDGLLSDRAKDREAAWKRLERSLDDGDFTSFLDKQTAEALVAADLNNVCSATWSALVIALCKCIQLYKTSQIQHARRLRRVVRRACGPDKRLFLMPNLTDLFKHLVGYICAVPVFETEYCAIVSDLLSDADYRACMDKKKYRDLITFLLNKNDRNLEFLSIIKYSPGNLPESLRPHVASRLAECFDDFSGRNELRKVLESVTLLLRCDGPDFVTHLHVIHSKAKGCLLRNWSRIPSSDKEWWILYLRMLFKLKAISDAEILEEWLSFVDKELRVKAWCVSQPAPAPWPVLPFLRFASHVIFEALRQAPISEPPICISEEEITTEEPSTKRRKKESPGELIKRRMSDSSSFWTGAICLVVKYYGFKLPADFLPNLHRCLVERLSAWNDVNSVNSETLRWTIRCLNEICDAGVPANDASRQDWQIVWDAVVQIIQMCSVSTLVDDSLKLLGCLALKGLPTACVIPDNFWELRYFKDLPERNALVFVASFFSSACFQRYELRSSMLAWSLSALSPEGLTKSIPPKLLSEVFLALSIGSQPSDGFSYLSSWSDTVNMRDKKSCQSEEQDKVQEEVELAALDLSEEVAAACGSESRLTSTVVHYQRTNLVRMSHSNRLLQTLADKLFLSVNAAHQEGLALRLELCVLVSSCFAGVESLRKIRDHNLSVWSRGGDVFKLVGELLDSSVILVNGLANTAEANEHLTKNADVALSDFVLMIPDDAFTSSVETLLKTLAERVTNISNDAPSGFHDADFDQSDGNAVSRDWRLICLSMIASIGQILPDVAFHSLLKLLAAEKDLQLRQELIILLSKVFRTPAFIPKLPELAQGMKITLRYGWNCEAVCSLILTAFQLLFSTLNAKREFSKPSLLPQMFLEILEIFGKLANQSFVQWRTRSKLADAFSTLFALDGDTALTFQSAFLKIFGDRDYRVRIRHAGRLHVLFETWTGHHQMLEDLYLNVGIKLPTTDDVSVTTTTKTCYVTTALVTMAEIAAASEQVETEAVFTILVVASQQDVHRTLVAAILDKLAKRLGYDRLKHLKQLLPGILKFWIAAKLPLSDLLKIKDLVGFHGSLMRLVLPCLLLHGSSEEVQWLAKVFNTTVRDLVESNLSAILSFLLVFKSEVSEGSSLLQELGLNANEQRRLLSKHMVSVAGDIVLLVRADDSAPSISRTDAVKLITSTQRDIRKMLSPEHVFQLLLQIHSGSSSSCHWRHKRHYLTKLEALMDLLGNGIVVASTFRYLMHIILESIHLAELQSQCCLLVSEMIATAKGANSFWIVGEQLQALVSKLVSCIVSVAENAEPSPAVLNLLRSVTVEAVAPLAPYVQELDQFPDLPCFSALREWQSEAFQLNTFSEKFIKFVQRAPFLPRQIRLWSLQSFCSHLRELRAEAEPTASRQNRFSSEEAANAVWKLVLLCNEEDDRDARILTAELLPEVGCGNPVFHANKDPLDAYRMDDMLLTVLNQLSIFLVDKEVPVIQLASETAKDLLATSDGYAVYDGKLSQQEKCYLSTFIEVSKRIELQDVLKRSSNKLEGNALAVSDSSLWSTSGKTHDLWISTLVHSLIDCASSPFLRLLQGLVLLKASLAEFLLPYVLMCIAGSEVPITSETYSAIGSQVRDQIFSDSNKNTKSIQVFLEAFNCLRICDLPARKEWPKVYWLDVDYLLTAKAAQKCAAYFTSILYVELWCEESFGRPILGEPQFLEDNKLPEHLERLLSVYGKIDEPDCVYGLIHAHNPVSQVRLYEHEGNWAKALETYDLLLASSSTDDSLRYVYYKGVKRALQQLGCSRVSEIYDNGLRNINEDLINDKEFKELQYEDAWKSGNWDLSSDVNDDVIQLGFHGKLHSSFQCLWEGDNNRFQSYVKQMKEEVVLHVVHTSRESTQNVYPAIVKLLMIECLSVAWTFRWSLSYTAALSNDQVQKLFAMWRNMLAQSRENYNLVEPLGSFLKVLLQVLERNDCLPSHLVQLSVLARKAGRLNQAAGTIQELKRLCWSSAGRIEEAKVLWAQGQQEMAVNHLKNVLPSINHSAAAAYCLAGRWLAETRSASSRVILDGYLQKSVQIAAESPREFIKVRSKTEFHLAHFANVLYQGCEDRLHSNEWKAASRLREFKVKEYNALVKKYKTAKKEEKPRIQLKAAELERQVKMDAAESARLNQDRACFLRVCLENYRSCLLTSDKYDMKVVFRLISLWFKLQTEQSVVDDMMKSITSVQSFKFLPLIYQIASRLGVSKAPMDFQFVLSRLVEKIAVEHPYHSLYQLLALTNGDRIRESSKKRGLYLVDTEKKQVATSLIAKLRNHHGRLITEVERMAEMNIRLAEFVARDPNVGKPQPLPSDICRLLPKVPVLTANVQIDRSCQYKDLPLFKEFYPKQMTIMRGVNAPKVFTCIDTQGGKYRQLAKSGGDDLRQDAVMEQIFGLVNDLLRHHPETRKRCLQVRTYKVVPLTPTAGVLEWVDGTVALGDYLLGSGPGGLDDGAHAVYGPEDWKFLKCRVHMIQETDKSKAFQVVCQNFRPVFRHFFRERFRRAADWFEKRLNYTRSVAANSMVGYIVGLGDRHAMNILIDNATAEVVHIDLGVAFEQGLMLKIPETIPFRLTRDIVDGMGVSGVEGVFRRCCEATLSVLRGNKDALLTIIEVFMHDPLYRWALSPFQALEKQKADEEEEEVEEMEAELLAPKGNKEAARALMRVRQKLDGYHDGEMRTTEGQVQQLLQEAQDPERLCQLYPGWGAWV